MSQYYIPRVGEPIQVYSPLRLRVCLKLLRMINQARRHGEYDLAEKLVKELQIVEGKT